MFPDQSQYFLDNLWDFETFVNIWTRRRPNYYQNTSNNTRKIWEHTGNGNMGLKQIRKKRNTVCPRYHVFLFEI